MIKKVTVVVALLLVCAFTVFANVPSWYWVDSDKDCTIYIDNANVENHGAFKIVWLRCDNNTQHLVAYTKTAILSSGYYDQQYAVIYDFDKRVKHVMDYWSLDHGAKIYQGTLMQKVYDLVY